MPDVKTEPTAATARPTRVGPYEIVGELGSGGMGRVFRARDPRLGRDVALKMLHRSADGDEHRVQRFLSEARAAGGLNHPNILAVYDVGTDGDQPYLVSELVEGASLRVELEAGTLPLARVLDLAAQIADGLAAAHHAHLVHRDLKPENVMVSRGRAKIVDFGLAKVTDAGWEATHTQTAPHAILGTPPYMSPEQARGAQVDYRSDIFSFGSMLYEMATGRRAFDRPTPIETLTAIQHDEPPHMRDVNGRVPPRLQQIVERCLAKAPDDRYASTADLHHDLKDLRDGRASTTSTVLPVQPAPWWQSRVLRVAAVALALAALVVTRLPAGRDLKRYRIVPIATDDGYEGSPVWSPDGRTLAYIAERDGVMQVMARTLDSSRAVQLTHAVGDCRNPLWSADGSRVYYISLAGTQDSLWSVSAAGGNPQMELRDVAVATLAPDGRSLVFLRDEGAFRMTLWRSSPVGQVPEPFAADWTGKAATGVSTLRFSPDGRKIGLWAASVDGPNSAPDRRTFWVLEYPSGRARHALADLPPVSRSHPFSWMADSRHLVFGADFLGRSPGTHLWIADTESADVEALTMSSTNEYEPSVSPEGARIAFVADASHYDVVEIPVDGGPVLPRRPSASDDADPAWSSSGRQFAYVTNRSGSPEIWLSDVEGTVDVPLVTRRSFQDETFLLSRLAMSPDGQRIVFERDSLEGAGLWAQPLAGGAAVPVVPRRYAGYQDSPTWSPDASWLAFLFITTGSKPDETDRVWRLGKTRPGANGEITEIRNNVNFLTQPQWSPDGLWITAEVDDGLVAVSPDGLQQRLLSRDPWIVHTWSRDSKSILAIRQSDDYRLQLAAIDVATQAVRVLNPDLGPVPPTTPPLRGFSLSPDGTRLLTSIARLRGDIHVLDGFERVSDLKARLTRLLPWSRPESSPSP